MKVLQLGINDRYGGASIAAYRQHTALRDAGVDSMMRVRFKTTNDPTVEEFYPPSTWRLRTARIARRQWKAWRRRRAAIIGEMFDAISEYGGNELSQLPDVDLINLQFAWDFIDYTKFFQIIPQEIPVVVTMHAMSDFTGGCSYTGGCTRFHERCGNCPKLEKRDDNDFSRQEWNHRRNAFAGRPAEKLHFVADSHWLAAEARKSGLLAAHPVSVIHYGLDPTIFRPLERKFARSVFGIPHEARVVSFAAAAVDDQRKGMKYLLEAIAGMDEKTFLLTWGKSHLPPMEGISHLHLGALDSEHLMALAYNASDVFAMPSLEEAFGQTALESIACGTPVAAFGAGGIIDTVRHEETGLIASVGDSDELRAAMVRLMEDSDLWESCSNKGVEIARNEFSMQLNAERYIDLYKSMLG